MIVLFSAWLVVAPGPWSVLAEPNLGGHPQLARSIAMGGAARAIADSPDGLFVHPAGLAAYDNRDPKLQKRYSFENPDAQLSPAQLKTFRANNTSWANFEAMPKSYRHPAIWWVVSARQEATRERRLATLIADSAEGVRVKHLRPLKPGAKTTP